MGKSPGDGLGARVTELSLDDMELSSASAVTLASGLLTALPSLHTLSLCHCELQAAGALAIAIAVSALPQFKLLKLDGNAIAQATLAKIKKILAAKQIELGGITIFAISYIHIHLFIGFCYLLLRQR